MAALAASSSVERADLDKLSYSELFVERQFFAEHAGATDSLRAKYGNWAIPAIRTALAFDAYFSWYYAWRNKVPLDAPRKDKEERALQNMQLAVDMHEMYERVSLGQHGSFMPHAAIYKITQSILEVGDVEAFDTSPLEMQNAETKRKAHHSTCATNRTTIPEGVSQRGPRKKEGPAGAPYSCIKSSNDSNHHLEEAGHFNQFATRQARRARRHSGRTAHGEDFRIDWHRPFEA